MLSGTKCRDQNNTNRWLRKCQQEKIYLIIACYNFLCWHPTEVHFFLFPLLIQSFSHDTWFFINWISHHPLSPFPLEIHFNRQSCSMGNLSQWGTMKIFHSQSFNFDFFVMDRWSIDCALPSENQCLWFYTVRQFSMYSRFSPTFAIYFWIFENKQQSLRSNPRSWAWIDPTYYVMC